VPIADVHWRLGLAAQAAIVALELPGDDVFGNIGERVYLQMFPDLTGLLMPCVILSYEGEKEEVLDGDSLNARWNYPLRVFIVDAESPRKHEKANLYLSWRKAIIDIFHKRRGWAVGNVPEAEGSRVIPEVIFDQRLPQYAHIVSGIVVWTSTTEPRANWPGSNWPGSTGFGSGTQFVASVSEGAGVSDVGLVFRPPMDFAASVGEGMSVKDRGSGSQASSGSGS
jgi:hypothetical protein